MSQPFGKFLLEECIGSGRFGLVFRARENISGRTFAVKLIPPSSNPNDISEFHNEGLMLQLLSGSNDVVSILESGSVGVSFGGATPMPPIPIPYIVMPLASGAANDLLEDPGVRNKIRYQDRLSLWRDATKGLRQMHTNNVVHRDLKSDNCLLYERRKNVLHLKLSDLGRSKSLIVPPVHPLTEYLSGRGHRQYSPPEYLLLQGDYSRDSFIAVDYYGLGSLLVEFLTGQPFTLLALGDFRSILRDSLADRQAGRSRSVEGFRGQFEREIENIAASVPSPIRDDIKVLVSRLCDPNPRIRLQGSPFSRDRMSGDPLSWVIRRVDIMTHRLNILERQSRHQGKGRIVA